MWFYAALPHSVIGQCSLALFFLFISSSSAGCHWLFSDSGDIYWSYSLVIWLFSIIPIKICVVGTKPVSL